MSVIRCEWCKSLFDCEMHGGLLCSVQCRLAKELSETKSKLDKVVEFMSKYKNIRATHSHKMGMGKQIECWGCMFGEMNEILNQLQTPQREDEG